MSFRAIASFELRYHLKAPLFWVLFALFFAFGLFAVTSNAVSLGGPLGVVHRNSPYVVMALLMLTTLLAPLTTTAFAANSIHRDFDLDTAPLFFSLPVKKWEYLGGRFAGSFAASLLVYCGIVAAIVAGAFAPWVPKAELGPLELYPYLFSLVVLVVPNLLLFGAIFFTVAALTRSLMATYSGVVVMYALYTVAGILSDDIERESVVGLLDPFGVQAWFLAVRYWSVFEKNTRVIDLAGVFLANRVLWLSVAAAALSLAYFAFSFTAGTAKVRRGRKEEAAKEERVSRPLPRVTQSFGTRTRIAQFTAAVRLETAATLKSVPLLVMLLASVFLVWGAAFDSGGILDRPYPVTSEMIDAILAGFATFGLLIAAFYAGEIVWRERALKLHEVTDALPVPDLVQWTAKLTSLAIVVFTSLGVAVLTTLAVQVSRGYYQFDPALYLTGVAGRIGSWLLLIAGLAFVLQLFFNHRMAAFAGMALYFIASLLLPLTGFQHPLYRYAATPPVEHTDMNGLGHYVAPLVWLTLYWFLFLALLLAVAHLFRVRGTDASLRQRARIARQRLGRRAMGTIALLFVAFASTGCFIFWNTNVLNDWRSSDETQSLQATAEKKYKRFEGIPQPRIAAVKANVDLHPERRAVYVDGSYVVTNRSGVPIRDLHVTWAAWTLTSCDVTIPSARLIHDDRVLGYRIYRLAQPLAPGRSLTMTYRTAFEPKGFPAGRANYRVAENGTFISNFDHFPQLGYASRLELDDESARRKHGLPPASRMKKPDDPAGLREDNLGRGSDWIDLDTTVSTSADQIAVAPGYLQREWSANGRRFFHYKSASPVRSFWAYLSARYAVKRDRWNDVAIEVFYHPRHPYNVDRMIHAVKKSLDYYTANFSPYQHEQVRIVEFPAYARFAQSLPNTIPYSEKVGFTADLRDPDAVDYVFYITAHEVAHQWWAHQVVGANVQGRGMLSETLAQYSALMVMERELPPEKTKRFRRYELDRYLDGRSDERMAESPLMLVEEQDYVQYNKGALAMYALQDAIGEERVNRALRKFIEARAFSRPPYPTATELVRYLRAEALPEQQSLITDLFERITLYDLEARHASVTRRADGKYAVKLTVAAKKLRAGATGEEKEVPIDDRADVVVLDENDVPLFSEKRRLTKAVETFELIVGQKPARAGVDPFCKLIDRNPKDNVTSL